MDRVRVFRRRRMKGTTDEGKEINPMFPRLHIKDAENGGPKAPPRNKMALHEKLSITSQSFDSGSASLLPLPLGNNSPGPSSFRHVCSSHRSQFSACGAPNSGVVKLNRLMPNDFLHCDNSLKKLDCEDGPTTPDSCRGRNSFCSISQKNNKDEDKLKSRKSFRRRVNINGSIELESAQYGMNQIEEHSEVSKIGQKPEEGSAHPLVGFGDVQYASSISSVDFRNLEAMKKAHASSKEEINSISGNSLTILQDSNCRTQEENATLEDKINFVDDYLEKPAVTDIHKCPGGLVSGKKSFQDLRNRHKGADIFRHCGASNKPISESKVGIDISLDDVVGVIGVKKFREARSTIINQQRVFLLQVFELHKLIKVQRIIAGSPHLLLEDNLALSKPSLEVSALKKLQSDFFMEQTSSIVNLNSKSTKPATERYENNAVGKIPFLCANNKSKGLVNQLSNYGHHSENPPPVPAATSTKQSPGCIYPLPKNQWLVPVVTPSEGLVYKPFLGSCPPNAGLMAPVNSVYGPMNVNPGNKDASNVAHAIPAPHKEVGILSGTPLPQFFPTGGLMHPSISASAVEQSTNPFAKMQSNGPENHKLAGYTILYQSSCHLSNQMSQVMSKYVANYHSSKDQNSQVVDHQPRVIKAMPHNPKSATESAARIFRSIQEERKHL